MRKAEIVRNTNETEVSLRFDIDGAGNYEIDTGCGFLTHMLELFCKHGRFDIVLKCKGDVHVDCHHTAEDVGIVLGRAFYEALGERRGIYRYGCFALPMDEALVLCAVDLCARGGLVYELDIPTETVGNMSAQDIQEFFAAFTREAKVLVHLHQMAGQNSHHIIEAAFKGCARALAAAAAIDANAPEDMPSTKGTIL